MRRRKVWRAAALIAAVLLAGCVDAADRPYPNLQRFPPVPTIRSEAERMGLRARLDADFAEGKSLGETVRSELAPVFAAPSPAPAGAADLSREAKSDTLSPEGLAH